MQTYEVVVVLEVEAADALRAGAAVVATLTELRITENYEVISVEARRA